jgi:acyl-CoA synthetase (AMP-forming)/AMP-acid ligase II
VSPLEVDGVLSAHPAIAQVVTFALPHPKLGEEVAAAVVLREGEDGGRGGDPGLRGRAAGGVQGAAQGGDPRRDPERARRASCSASGWRRSWGWWKAL